MGRKLRHLLIFLLIILKEPNMQEAVCSCAPSAHCKCVEMGLTSIPPDLPTSISSLDLTKNRITAVNQSLLLRELRQINPEEMICEEPTISSVVNASQSAHPVGLTSPTQPPVNPLEIADKCYNATVTSRYHWFFTRNSDFTDNADFTRNADFTPQNTSSNIRATLTSTLTVITSDKPESATSFNLSILIGSVCGSGAGLFVLIGTILGAVWYKRRTRHPPVGLNPSNSNTNAAVPFRNPSRSQLLAALQSNPIYADVKAPQENPISTEMAIGHDQTGQGQSQAITNTTADVMASGDDHQYEDVDNYHDQTGQGQSQAITESNTNVTLMAPVMTSGHDQTGWSQSQAITESNTNTTATAMTSGHDQIGWGQSQAITESNTNTTATAMTSGHDQTGQGQSQANIQSLTVLKHDQVLAALEPNFMHVGVETLPKEIASCHEQAGQGQSQTNTELLDTRNPSYGPGKTASQGNSLYQ
ncbi:corticospinal neuron axon guidance through spinal cord [Branchiostoma belcheri]|nr:corticospinal neuron axon guidance through spinal cord [Branchiostoma belcheri]